MEHSKSIPLYGNLNKRIDKLYELESEANAAWTNTAKTAPKTNIPIPSEEAVVNAKEWVDNGSRL